MLVRFRGTWNNLSVFIKLGVFIPLRHLAAQYIMELINAGPSLAFQI